MGFIGRESYDIDRSLSVSFTGHRPGKLPWSSDGDERCAAFIKSLEAQIVRAYNEGARYFLSGMADGVDVYAAEAVLRLSYRLPEIRLVAVFPFGTGDSSRKRRIAARAHVCVSLHKAFVPYCYTDRNMFLVRHASRLICGYGGDASSGTAATMRMAEREGIDIVVISTALPAGAGGAGGAGV